MRFILILYFLLPFASVASEDTPDPVATTLKYCLSGSGNYYPYYTHDADKPGILPEIVKAILTTANIQGENLELPAKRTIQYLNSEQIDFDILSPSWLTDEEKRNPKFVFSAPIMDIKEFVVTQQKTPKGPLLRGQHVGTVRGYYYHDDMLFERLDFSSERELLQALKMGRVDRIIIGDLPARYWGEKLGIDFELNAEHSSGSLHLRLLAKHHALLPKLNAAIQVLRDSGRVAEIEQSYVTNLHSLPHNPH